MANDGWTIDQIVQEMARYPNGIALKYADRLHQEVTRSYEKWQRQNPGQQSALPVIRSVDGQIARMVDEAQTALIAPDVPIFVRGGMLVEPITVERQAADDRKTMVTVFAPLSEEKLGYLLNKHAAVFMRYDLKRKKWVKIDPPPKVTAALLKLKSWKFPEVVGIVGAPTMRPDGSILSERWLRSGDAAVVQFGYRTAADPRKTDPRTRLNRRFSCSRIFCPVFPSSAPLISPSLWPPFILPFCAARSICCH